jgi:hypothetical protein
MPRDVIEVVPNEDGYSQVAVALRHSRRDVMRHPEFLESGPDSKFSVTSSKADCVSFRFGGPCPATKAALGADRVS